MVEAYPGANRPVSSMDQGFFAKSTKIFAVAKGCWQRTYGNKSKKYYQIRWEIELDES